MRDGVLAGAALLFLVAPPVTLLAALKYTHVPPTKTFYGPSPRVLDSLNFMYTPALSVVQPRALSPQLPAMSPQPSVSSTRHPAKSPLPAPSSHLPPAGHPYSPARSPETPPGDPEPGLLPDVPTSRSPLP